jgi:3,4-dihydroxyphthalate decarboxylase
MTTPPTSTDEARALVAQGCRILAAEGLVSGILGHISLRWGDGQMLIRCRGPRERGLAFTEAADIHLVDLDGRGLASDDGHSVPNEHPIHGELMKQRPDAMAVVHAHPPAVLACGIAGLPLRPIFGAYDIPAAHMAAAGIPVYPRSVLIRRADLAHEMLAAMGDRPVCVLKGHGITVAGGSVEEAVVTAISLNTLAAVTLAVAQTGTVPEPIPDEDLAELPDLGPAFNADTAWRYFVANAATAGR